MNSEFKRVMPDGEIVAYDEEGINYDDIPPTTNFTKWRKNPFAGRFKDGYTVIVEHEGYNEIRKYDFTKIPRSSTGDPIPVEVTIEKATKAADMKV